MAAATILPILMLIDYEKDFGDSNCWLAVGMALVFIVNNVASDTFPLLIEEPMNESDYIKQTYEAGLDFCENNYGGKKTIEKNEEYRKCIDSVETWHAENLEK